MAESRSVDDQVEWLDDEPLAFSDGTNVYTVPADGSGEEQLLIKDAASPCASTATSNQKKLGKGGEPEALST